MELEIVVFDVSFEMEFWKALGHLVIWLFMMFDPFSCFLGFVEAAFA
jgi:hypothetical protein